MDDVHRFLFTAVLLDGKTLLTVAVSFVTALLTTFAAPVIRYWLDNLRLTYKLRTEYEYEQRKRLRDLIAHYHGGILNAADIFKTRVFNLYENEGRGWLEVKEKKGAFKETGKNYRSAGYYFATTVYRFVAVSTWIHRFEAETFYLDSRFTEKGDFAFLSQIKLLQKAATDVTLFRGLKYDDSEAKDHLFSDTLRTIADSCWKEGRFLNLEEFKSKIGVDHNLDSTLEFFDGLNKAEDRLRWDRLVVFHLLLVGFINTFGYKFQQTEEHEVRYIIKKIKHPKIRKNMVGWLREYAQPGDSMNKPREGMESILSTLQTEADSRQREGQSSHADLLDGEERR